MVVASSISASLYGDVVKRVLPMTINQDMVYLVLDIPITGDGRSMLTYGSLCVQRFYPQSQDHLSHKYQPTTLHLTTTIFLMIVSLNSFIRTFHFGIQISNHWQNIVYLVLLAAVGKMCPLSPPQYH